MEEEQGKVEQAHEEGGRRRALAERQALDAFAAIVRDHGLGRACARGADNLLSLDGCPPIPIGDLRIATGDGQIVVEVESDGGVGSLVKLWCAFDEGAIEGKLTLIHLFRRAGRREQATQLRLWRFVASRMHAALGRRFAAYPFPYSLDGAGVGEALALFERLVTTPGRGRRTAAPPALTAPPPPPPAPPPPAPPAVATAEGGVRRPDRGWDAKIKDLLGAHAALLAAARRLPAEAREREGVCGTWSARELLAHLAGWDREAVRRFAEMGADDAREPLYDVDAFNAASVRTRRGVAWDAVLAELEVGFAALRQAAMALPPARRRDPRFAEWLEGRARDYAHHAEQLKRASVASAP